MARYKNLFAAVFATAAITLSGCGNSPVPTDGLPAETTAAVTTTVGTTTAETSAEEKTVNKVRTAEELAGKKVIALTFDDGPNTGVTGEIIDIAGQYGIKVSFFVVGQEITPESAEMMKRAYSLGCEINSHSYTHSDMTTLDADTIKEEMRKTAELIYDTVGEYPHFFRPPYISVNSTMYECIDLPFISGIGCNDWEDDVSVEKRVRFLTQKCSDGEIVLLHDQKTNEKTAEAVRQAVPVLLEQGFEFVTVSELFAAKGITPSSTDEIIYNFATVSGQKE